jgi:hypothetical protein
MDWSDEESWLRGLVIRLRFILRYARDPTAEAALRLTITEAESRLELLEERTPREDPPIRAVNRLPFFA